MNSRDQAHLEDQAALRRLERQPLLIVAVALVALIAATALVYAIVNAHTTDQVRKQSLAGCRLYKVVAEAPLAPQTSALGLQLAAGARTAYDVAQCHLGTLKPADPRIVPLLPPGVK